MNAKLPKQGAAPTGGPSRAQKANGFGELRAYNRKTEIEVGREVLRSPDDHEPAFERLVARSPSDSVIHFVFRPHALSRIPANASERKLALSEIEKYLTEELSHCLSQADFALFRLQHLEAANEAALPRIRAALDSVIFQAAMEQGPIILLVPEILQRVNDWPFEGEDGARRWERLGQSFAQMSRVARGIAKAPLDPWWARSRSAIIREVSGLRKSLNVRLAGRFTPAPNWVLQDAAVDAVQEPSTFPKLGQIQVLFQLFLSANPGSLRNFMARSLTAAHFTDELIGWVTNYKPGSVSQIIRRNF